MAEPTVSFVRLTEVANDDVVALLNEPRNARHMPLVGEPFTGAAAAAWVASKDEQWERNGYGPWAVLLDGAFAGWGGFQAEPDGADLALVLHPRFWGSGARVARSMIDAGFDDLGLEVLLVSLPYSRRSGRALARWGFASDGEAMHGGVRFQRYRLTRERWSASKRAADAQVRGDG